MNIKKHNKLIKANIDSIWGEFEQFNLIYNYEKDHPNNFSNLKFEQSIDGTVYYYDGGYFTERISFDTQNRTLNFEVVERRKGPMMFSKGRITLIEISPQITEIELDMTHDQNFGMFGPLMSFILEYSSLIDFVLDISIAHQHSVVSKYLLSDSIETNAIVNC